MESITNLNTEKHYLGQLCLNNHDNGEGKSWRYYKSNRCILCRRERSSKHQKQHLEESNAYKRNYYQLRKQKYKFAEKHYVGLICKYNHDYGNQKSLRFRSSSNCVECMRQAGVINREKNKDRILINQRRYCKNNPEKVKQSNKKYSQSQRCKEKQVIYTNNRRSRKKEVHSTYYTASEFHQRKQQFNECCYCGSLLSLSIDHLIPLSKGGADVLGNLVPACGSCNSSKSNADAYEWYSKQSFFSRKRWAKILKVLGKTQATYNQNPLF
jgi:5-methylcytosine-specific restriction endonuclease McrA